MMETAVAEQEIDQASGEGLQELMVAEDAMQYLTFEINGEEYGVDILKVQEIKGWTTCTRIPNVPAHVQGVLNLRGAIVPVVDMRLRMAIEPKPYTKLTVVVIVSVRVQERERVMGLVVDGVSDVLSVRHDDLQQPPELGSAERREYIQHIIDVDERMVMVLDIDKLMERDEDIANLDLSQ